MGDAERGNNSRKLRKKERVRKVDGERAERKGERQWLRNREKKRERKREAECLGRKEWAARLYEGVEEGGESARRRRREMRLKEDVGGGKLRRRRLEVAKKVRSGRNGG